MLKNLSKERNKHSIVITVVGDIMQHQNQHASEKSRDYSYEGIISDEVLSILQNSDLVVGNLETIVSNDEPSGFPKFRTHPNFIKALHKAGINVLSVANNHSLDWGELALKRSTQYVESFGITTVGYDKSMLKTIVEGRNVNIHAMTDISNVEPSDSTGLIIGVDKIRPQYGINIALCHIGKEYSEKPTDKSLQIAEKLTKLNFDAVFCIHSHVIGEDSEIVTKSNRYQYQNFGMGNFISDQQSLDRQLGQIVQLTFDRQGLTSIDKFVVESIFEDNHQKVILI